MGTTVPTLERATRQARDEARRGGAPVYVIELENEAAGDWDDVPPPDPLAGLALREEWARQRREWDADPAGCRAAGMLPPWEDIAGPDGADEEAIDPHDPIVFSTIPAPEAALLVRMQGAVELLRVAHPDGRVEAVPDPDGESARLLVAYADYLRDHPPL